MKTETMATTRRQKTRALAWAAALGALLLVPQDLPAQKDKTSTGSSSKSSSSASKSSSSARSAPARSAPSRSSVSRSTPSRSSRSTPSVSSRSKAGHSKAPSRSQTRSQAPSRAARGIDPSVKSRPPVRVPKEPDKPGRGDEVGDPNPSYGQHTARRGHRPGHPYYPYYRPYSYSYYPYYFYGPYGYFFHPYGYGYGPATRSRGPRYGDAMGGLDLNVKPKKAEVYVDGTPIGPVDRYDGFPSYLWLEPGAYELAFYLEGYETLLRQVSIYPGVVVDVDERLVPGTAVPPPPPELGGLPPAAAGEPETAGGGSPGAGVGVARLQLSIRPGDTAVYLDGHFLGTGEELAQLSAGLIVEPGDHVLELVRPGYVTEEVPISVPAGERIEIDLTLRQR